MAVVIPELVRLDLAAQRAAGVNFEAAWPQVVHQAVQTADEADEWLVVLHATRGAWAAAYEGREAKRAERSLLAVAVDPDREPLEGPATRGLCQHCSRPIPAERLVHDKPRRPVRYCSPRCRRDASVARLAA